MTNTATAASVDPIFVSVAAAADILAASLMAAVTRACSVLPAVGSRTGVRPQRRDRRAGRRRLAAVIGPRGHEPAALL
jgi:NhaP-type Na+/H+ or K+/H+ antiporter